MFRTALANAPRPSGSLRPTRSLGALRSTAASHSAFAVPPVPSRTLVSSVLLTRESYDAKNVQQLKSECKQRGLTTNGRRADIVARLLNDDAKQSGSDLTTDAAPSPLRSSTSQGQIRSNASLASLRSGKSKEQKQPPSPNSSTKGTPKKPAPAPEKPARTTEASPAQPQREAPLSKSSPATEASPAAQPAQEGASISHPSTIKPGQVQHPGLQTSSAEGGVSSPDKKLSPDSNPPGVPPQKEPNVPETFKVDIPREQPAAEAGPEIPIVTAYTTNRGTDDVAPVLSSGPRVVTASGEGDVVHALDVNSPLDVSQTSEALSSATRTIKKDLGLAGDLTAQVGQLLSSTSALRTKASEATSAVLSDASSSLGNLTGKASAVFESAGNAPYSGGQGSGRRAMNADEKRGLYVLGGLVLGGFTLGSFGKPKKNKH